MTPQQYHEACVRLMFLRSEVRTLDITSVEYKTKLAELTRLDAALKRIDSQFPTNTKTTFK